MIELIPAIDIIDGKCVRLSQGDYQSKVIYNENPLEVAKEMADYGMTRLHIVDLDGAKSQHIINHHVLHTIASQTSLVIDFGGGIKSDKDLEIAFNSGAQMVTIGSVAVSQPERMAAWIARFGGERIILGADVKHGNISTHGWLKESNQLLLPFLEHYTQQGISKVLCTDISKDGMLQGPALSLYEQVMAAFPTLHLIASGGVSCMEDIAALNRAGIPAVVFGKALYEGRITLRALQRFMEQKDNNEIA